MEYLVYILAGFGIFSLLVLLIRLISWFFQCICSNNKKTVPICESAAYTLRNSLMNVNEKEAIQQFDQMLDQYTKPKVVISRQCICPFCTKEPQKIIFNESVETNDGKNNCFSNQIIEEMDDKTNESYSDFDDTYIEVDDILIIDDSKEEMPCNLYNHVVLELKNKFSTEKQTEVKKIFDSSEDYP